MHSQTKEKIEKLTRQRNYTNSRELSLGSIPYSVRETVLAAPLIASLNGLFVGGTGEGKTQLANDITGLVGDRYCYTEGRPDFELSELFKHLNLEKLREAKTDRELVELTENTQKALFYVDELNRCPPIIMNYFFNFFDGKVVHNGKIFRLGKDGYSTGFASGNLGDGAYVGISDTDRALKDRMHLIVKLDDPEFCTTEKDDGEIFGTKRNPRASLPDASSDCYKDILELNKEFKEREVPLILPALGVFFHKGLDYLENTKRHSKRALDMKWPNVQGIRQDTDESKIFPLSKRGVLAAIALTQALEMIAESKGYQVKDTSELFLDAMKLTVPYSGVLAPNFVHIENDGDVYEAFDSVMKGIKTEVRERKNALEKALALAQYGAKDNKVLDKISPVSKGSKWLPVRRHIETLAEEAQKDGVKKQKLEKIIDEIKKPATGFAV